MAKLIRDHRLETRSARLKLNSRDNPGPYWREIYRGTALGYRRGKWIIRQYQNGRYRKKTIGRADDIEDANGKNILSFKQAQEIALAFHADDPAAGYTVADACRDYLADYETRSGKDTANIECTYNKHVIPEWGGLEVAKLTSSQLRRWLNALAGDGSRPKKSTANKHLTKLKAALNFAFRENLVADDRAWRIVKPFKNVDAPRTRILTDLEVKKLIKEIDDTFRPMVKAALLTGCRYGELCRLRVRDFYGDHIHIAESKSGKPRDIPLTTEGQEFFSQAVSGCAGSDFIFTRDDASPWEKSHQHRRMRAACKEAKIDPPISFHILRHAYGGALARAGVSLQIIAAVLGHADTRMTEKHYAHLQPSHVADVIRKNLPKLEG